MREPGPLARTPTAAKALRCLVGVPPINNFGVKLTYYPQFLTATILNLATISLQKLFKNYLIKYFHGMSFIEYIAAVGGDANGGENDFPAKEFPAIVNFLGLGSLPISGLMFR